MKKMKTTVVIAAGIGLFVLFLWWLGALQGWENKTIDYRFALRGETAPSSDIVIIAIDDESIEKMGRWPWPRNVHGMIVSKLTQMGAKVIMFDVLFTEADIEHPHADEAFGEAIRRSGRVVVNSFFRMERGALANPFVPIQPIAQYSRVGFANIFTEMDGINRKIPVIKDYEGQSVPSFALSGLSAFLDKAPWDIIKEQRLVIDEYNEMLINFSGGYKAFPYYSYHEVLKGNIADDAFRGKIVLVGGTATALFDFKAVPFSPIFPGVEIHANAMSNILLKNFLIPWPETVTALLIICFSLFAGLALGRLAPFWGGVTTLVIFAGYFLLTYVLFASKNINAEFVAPGASLAFSYVGVLFFRFMTEEKEKRHIKKTFSQYLNPRVMEKVLSDPSYLKLGGHRQMLTVLFSDIRGFTTITESLPAEELVNQLNEYLSKMVEVVFRHDGTLDKFIGDAVMAYWGAPVPQNDHIQRAVLCAIDMHKELNVLQDKWRAEGKKVFEIGVGVNTGDMTVGNMGSKEKMEYTVIGDNVNLASRLEGLNKEYHSKVIISESVYLSVKEIVDAVHLDSVKVKGKTKPVEIYAVLGKRGEAPIFDAAALEKPKTKEEPKAKEAQKKAFNPDARIQTKNTDIN